MGIFKNLASIDVLDMEYENKSDINVEAQRAAWIDAGTTEAKDWTDLQVKKIHLREVYLVKQM